MMMLTNLLANRASAAALGLLVFAVLLINALACSPFPLSRAEDAKIDLRLAGVWQKQLDKPAAAGEASGAECLAFIPFNERAFVMWHGKDVAKPYDQNGWKSHESYRAFITEIDGELYLNLQLLSPELTFNPTLERPEDLPQNKQNDKPLAPAEQAQVDLAQKTGMMPLYTFAKIEVDGDTLRMTSFDWKNLDEDAKSLDSIEATRKFVLAHPERFSQVQTYRWVPRPKKP